MFLTIRRTSYAECILMLKRLAMSSHSLPFAVLQMSWKCELICNQGEPNDERYTYCSNGFLNNRTGMLIMFLITFRPFSLPGRIWGLVHSIILTWTVSCQFCLLEIRCLKREHTRSLATASAVTLMRNAFLFFLVLLEITVNLPLST